MFVACPHCGYLVALIVAKDGPARACPRCGGSLQSEAPAAAAADGEAAPAAQVEAALDAGAEAAPAPAQAASAAAPAGDDISRSLRRAPIATGHTATVAPPAAEAARGQAAAASAPQPDPIAEAGDDDDERSSADLDSTATTATADDATTPQPAAGEEPRDDDDAADADAPAETALSPLSAAVVAASARERRQRKSETTVTSARRAPSFARQQARAQAAKPRLHWSGPAAIVALILALALQLLLAQRAELAADARWRPLVSGLCGALGCAVAPWREPAALTMLNRNVLPVADRTGVLRVSAGFRNDARWAQPWPVLVLSLEDVDGRRVGQRAFAPEEYRRGYRPDELIAPGQSAAVQFEVIEPAPRVVAFTFDFR